MLILLGYDQYRPGRGVTFPRSGSVLPFINCFTATDNYSRLRLPIVTSTESENSRFRYETAMWDKIIRVDLNFQTIFTHSA